jgi:hypothetical protein
VQIFGLRVMDAMVAAVLIIAAVAGTILTIWKGE